MHFRAIAERPTATPRGGMSRLLLGFVVLSVSAHSLFLVTSSPPDAAHRVSLGTPHIHVTLSEATQSSPVASSPPAAKNAADGTAKNLTAPTQPQANSPDTPSVAQPKTDIPLAANKPFTDTVKRQPSVQKNIPADITAQPITPSASLAIHRHADQTTQALSASRSDKKATETQPNPQPAQAMTALQNNALQREALRNYLLGEIRDQLSRYLTYPQRARRRGWEGEVLLALHISQQGKLQDIQIVNSSGYASLDRSAINSLSRIDKLRLPTSAALQKPLKLQLPVIYRLNGNQ